MKHKSYKNIITFFALCLLGTLNAQKFDKKFTESFKVNKDVEVAINVANTDINVTIWNKNEVQINAFIEIEGISKKEADKFFKDWGFEALSNSKKVKITSKINNAFSFKNDYVFFDTTDFDIQIPKIDISNIETIVIPYLNFDFDSKFDFDFESLKDLEKIMKKDGKFSFQWNDGNHKISINSKKEWKTFKKTKKYKDLKLKMLQEQVKMKMKLLASNQQLKKRLEKAKLEYKKIDKEKVKAELEKTKEQLRKMKFSFSTHNKDITIDGKKIKIKKSLEIKVPKNATFNLNTRHCKVKLPNSKVSGNVSYGSFNANNLNGGKLDISYSPVNINDMNACTLFLNNVTDAKIASVTNTTISNNSSGVSILKVNKNVDLTHKFGELSISNIIPNYQSFKLMLDYTEADIDVSNISKTILFNKQKASLFLDDSSIKLYTLDKGSIYLNGNFVVKSKDDSFKIQGKYSQITVKK